MYIEVESYFGKTSYLTILALMRWAFSIIVCRSPSDDLLMAVNRCVERFPDLVELTKLTPIDEVPQNQLKESFENSSGF
jgi:hypothetical protein